MKNPCLSSGSLFLIPSPKKLAAVLLVASAAAAQASIIASESFDYSDGLLYGQTGSGTGFGGDWALSTGFGANNNNGTNFFSVTSESLAMSGVYSSGGKLAFATGDNTTKAVARTFSSPLSTNALYGSYLFRITADTYTNGRTVGGIMVNTPGQNDNSGTFSWAANGYNSNSGNVEGPNIRVSGATPTTPVQTPIPTFNLTVATTYIMLFEFDATTKTTSAWVLNEAQLTNFYGSLNSATLNLAAGDTESADGVVWKGSVVSSAETLPSMDELTLIGLASAQGLGYGFEWDEIRFSDTSLLEAVAVPEPSTVAVLGLAFGAFAIRGVLRRRREA